MSRLMQRSHDGLVGMHDAVCLMGRPSGLMIPLVLARAPVIASSGPFTKIRRRLRSISAMTAFAVLPFRLVSADATP